MKTAVLIGALLGALLLMSVGTARADQTTIPALAAVPDGIDAARRTALLRQRQMLDTTLRNFQAAGAAFNAKDAKDQTDEEYEALLARRGRYIAAATDFNRQVDTAVVDARNVPSGLPASVDAQIPHTPTGDRLRKGYQGIQAHDWPVALAWFQEAGRYEPNDAGIARLIDLAQSAVEARARPNGAAHAVQRYLETRTDPQFQAQWTAFVTEYLPGHPEMTTRLRAALDAADASQGAPKRLSSAAVAQRIAELNVAAQSLDDEATANMIYSFMLPREAGAAAQSMRDQAVMQAETSAALRSQASAIKQCGCEPPLRVPSDSDIKFLFPLGTDVSPYSPTGQ